MNRLHFLATTSAATLIAATPTLALAKVEEVPDVIYMPAKITSVAAYQNIYNKRPFLLYLPKEDAAAVYDRFDAELKLTWGLQIPLPEEIKFKESYYAFKKFTVVRNKFDNENNYWYKRSLPPAYYFMGVYGKAVNK